jgi:hypothetical protein
MERRRQRNVFTGAGEIPAGCVFVLALRGCRQPSVDQFGLVRLVRKLIGRSA